MILLECRCIHCNRYLFSYNFNGEFYLTIKCEGCRKVNTFGFAKVTVTATPLSVI